jgi:hypothetical protein
MSQTYKFGNGKWATKKGSTLAYNDENNNFKPLPFTTTRDSIATRVNKEGLIEVVSNDVPRIDYTDSADGALLLENSATNLFEYSEDFSNSYWSKIVSGSGIAPIVTAEYAISPDGTQNATRVQFDAVGSTNSDRSGLVRNFAFTTGQTYSISCWVKSTNETNQIIQFRLAGSQVSEEQIATSEWKLYTATFTATASVTDNFGMQIRGINSVNESDILIYGMQLELSNYPTSYIPTSGSTVTRLADTANGSGNSEVFNDSEGVLFADISALANDSIGRKITLNNGSNSQVLVLEYTSTVNQIRVFSSNGSLQFNEYITISDLTNFNKIAIKYKVNNFAIWVNGLELATDLIGTTFSSGTLTNLNFDDGSGNADFYGKTKEIGYYDEILTDAELETLTSYRSLNELVTELNLNTL